MDPKLPPPKHPGPLRRLFARIFRPTLRRRNLLPLTDLTPGIDPTEWTASGTNPSFLLQTYIPKGYIRLRLNIKTKAAGEPSLSINSGEGFNDDQPLQLGPASAGIYIDRFLRVKTPVLQFRFRPVQAPGPFTLRAFRINSYSFPGFLIRSLWSQATASHEQGRFSAVFNTGLRLLLHGDFAAFKSKLMGFLRGDKALLDEEYQRWFEHHAITPVTRRALQQKAAELAPAGPTFSILMPVFDCPEPFLRKAIDSVRRQIYPKWELCIADDKSTHRYVREVLRQYAAMDPRIKITFRSENGNISAASNSALELATGQFTALLDNDDELAEQALLRFAQAIAADPELDMLYSDEDKIAESGAHVEPFFKPDWSPDHLLSTMYTCHLTAYRTELLRKVGGFRTPYDYAQDFDLALRIAAKHPIVAHVPEILYHWRIIPGSTAGSFHSKPHAHELAQLALKDYLAQTKQDAIVETGFSPGFHRLRWKIKSDPLISIIIPSRCDPVTIKGKKTTYLQHLINSITTKSTYKNYEILIVTSGTGVSPVVINAPTPHSSLITHHSLLTYDFPFNWAAVNNLAAKAAKGDHLLFLNDDMEVISPDWLQALLEQSQRPEIGAVGGKLLFADGRIQHVGVALQNQTPGHPFYGAEPDNMGYRSSNHIIRNCLAVTGACLMTPAKLFCDLGGFDTSFKLNYNDVDYCLKVITSGLRVVFTPYAQLYHLESMTKSKYYPEELAALQKKWSPQFPRDPFINPNFSPQHWDYRLGV